MAHLDVKPDNVLAGDGGKYVLADFGCAKEVDADGCLSGACGTPLYMAPEMHSKKGFSPKADVFSVGVLMCVCALWYQEPLPVHQFLNRAKKLPNAQQALDHPFLAGMQLEDLL
ncbi:hypothetical protein GPECTOR_30g171 [Gonium pectorale]|uniref:Protein kinase domain-containing protein n=1 Tax=Gonium pectorale TaxID=33097 RepID=A0A150GE15_GONPE|nr:hypothetical protein GPECTOR_30g171 [Gonium pectorale]|eukprot:KXZ48076.1 hypothetical protein GPECTOR_30g171 [Gonium pectorale]